MQQDTADHLERLVTVRQLFQYLCWHQIGEWNSKTLSYVNKTLNLDAINQFDSNNNNNNTKRFVNIVKHYLTVQ